MPQSTARVLALLEILQSGGTPTLGDLAARLDVDKRTVRRYIDQLRDLDVPVDSVRGRYGGYRLARNFRMPPLMLNDEEALAVVWALLATRHAGPGHGGSGPVSADAAENATAKIRRVLPRQLGRRIDAVLATVDFAGTKQQVTPDGANSADGAATLLLDIAEAARDRRPVSFGYTSGRGRETSREVHPRGLVAHGGLLYLAGHDGAKQAPRTFRLDRMRNLRVLDGSFLPAASPTALEQVTGPLPADPSRHDVSVLVEADPEHVRQFLPELLASVEPVGRNGEGGWVRVCVRAERLDWVAQRLAAIDRPFVVEHPTQLRSAVEGLARRLLTSATAEPG